MTVFGAIVSNSSRFHYSVVHGGTTGNSSLQFLQQLQQELGEEKFADCVLVMDKAQGHNAIQVQSFLQQSGITVMRLPTASSVLNSIERVWAKLKRHFQQRLFETQGHIPAENIVAEVNNLVEEHINGKCLDFANGNKGCWL